MEQKKTIEQLQREVEFWKQQFQVLEDILRGEPTKPASSCSEPQSFCNDCGCGKKERILNEKTKTD